MCFFVLFLSKIINFAFKMSLPMKGFICYLLPYLFVVFIALLINYFFEVPSYMYKDEYGVLHRNKHCGFTCKNKIGIDSCLAFFDQYCDKCISIYVRDSIDNLIPKYDYIKYVREKSGYNDIGIKEFCDSLDNRSFCVKLYADGLGKYIYVDFKTFNNDLKREKTITDKFELDESQYVLFKNHEDLLCVGRDLNLDSICSMHNKIYKKDDIDSLEIINYSEIDTDSLIQIINKNDPTYYYIYFLDFMLNFDYVIEYEFCLNEILMVDSQGNYRFVFLCDYLDFVKKGYKPYIINSGI